MQRSVRFNLFNIICSTFGEKLLAILRSLVVCALEIRIFLNAAREKGGFDITRKDTNRLVDMINCVDRNKFMSKKHLLTLLREQRNERAHGEIPDLKEREKLMQHAPFLVDSYIEYIMYFREKRKEL